MGDDTAYIDAELFDPGVSKKKRAPRAPTSDLIPLPATNTKAYADIKWLVDRYHAITHRSKELIENDILAKGNTGLKPGWTRAMSPYSKKTSCVRLAAASCWMCCVLS